MRVIEIKVTENRGGSSLLQQSISTSDTTRSDSRFVGSFVLRASLGLPIASLAASAVLANADTLCVHGIAERSWPLIRYLGRDLHIKSNLVRVV